MHAKNATGHKLVINPYAGVDGREFAVRHSLKPSIAVLIGPKAVSETPLKPLQQFYIVQYALYDLRRHSAVVQDMVIRNKGKKANMLPMLDYTKIPMEIVFGAGTSKNQRANVIPVIVRMGGGPDFRVPSSRVIDIPWKFARQYLESFPQPSWLVNPLSIPAGPRQACIVKIAGVPANVMAVPDEVDMLCTAVLDENNKRPDPTKHIWQRIEELTQEIRKPQKWPLKGWGPFVPPDAP